MALSLKSLFSSLSSSVVPAARTAVGIDLGGSSVKVVEIEDTEKALTLRTYGELQLGPYANGPLGDVVKLEQKKRVEAIVDVIREAGVTANTGVLVIPLSVSFMTVIPVSARANEDLTSKIAIEARKYIPLPLADVALDWTEIAASNAPESGMREVMIAAIEHNTVREYKEMLDAIGMASQPSEIEAFSLVRALNRENDTTTAILDLGAQTSKLYIAADGMIERLHRVLAGGSMMTRRIAEMRNFSFADAENLKRGYTPGSPDARDIEKVVTSVLDGPLLEFKRIIDQYEARSGPVGRVVLAGGVAAFPGITAYAKDVLGREVEIGNSFDKVAYPAFMEDTLSTIAPSFGVAMGAALRYFA